jgi:hypothetical protein
MLGATALGLGDGATAQLEKRHLDDYARIVMQISKALPQIVLEELAVDGENVRTDATGLAERLTSDAWR